MLSCGPGSVASLQNHGTYLQSRGARKIEIQIQYMNLILAQTSFCN